MPGWLKHKDRFIEYAVVKASEGDKDAHDLVMNEIGLVMSTTALPLQDYFRLITRRVKRPGMKTVKKKKANKK